MKLIKTDIRILSIIYKSSHSLFAFTIYKRLKVPFPEFSKAISRLIAKGILYEQDRRLQITSEGIECLLAERNNYLVFGEKKWRKIPSDFIQMQLQVNDFYVPKRDILDSSQFKKR